MWGNHANFSKANTQMTIDGWLKPVGTRRSFQRLLSNNKWFPFLRGLKFLFIYFRKRGRWGEKEGEKYWCVRETSISCLLHMPHLGTRPTPQAHALTRNWSSDLWLCRTMLNPLSHASQGNKWFQSIKFGDDLLWSESLPLASGSEDPAVEPRLLQLHNVPTPQMVCWLKKTHTYWHIEDLPQA